MPVMWGERGIGSRERGEVVSQRTGMALRVGTSNLAHSWVLVPDAGMLKRMLADADGCRRMPLPWSDASTSTPELAILKFFIIKVPTLRACRTITSDFTTLFYLIPDCN